MIEYDKYCFKSKEKRKYVKKEDSYCVGCRKKKKKNINGVVLENKIRQQKSTCVDCDSKKSTFLKQVKNKKIVFTNYKTCKFIVQSVKNITIMHVQKNWF